MCCCRMAACTCKSKSQDRSRSGRDDGGRVRGDAVPSEPRYAVRYTYEHSILPYDDPDSHWDGKPLERGHRLSLMVRVS